MPIQFVTYNPLSYNLLDFMNIQLYFGIAIKQLRISQKISQEKFALHINMNRTCYASVENGHRNISINNIPKIADGFNISLTELFRLVNKKKRYSRFFQCAKVNIKM